MWNWVYILFWQKVNIIRLSIWKMDGFSPVKVKSIYIWNLLLKSFPAIGAWWAKVTTTKVTYCCFLEKKSLKRQYLTGTENEKTLKKVFFNVHLIRNLLVYVEKRKSEKEFLVIFMRKWVYILFCRKGQYDKTLYIKSGRFSPIKVDIFEICSSRGFQR